MATSVGQAVRVARQPGSPGTLFPSGWADVAGSYAARHATMAVMPGGTVAATSITMLAGTDPG